MLTGHTTENEKLVRKYKGTFRFLSHLLNAGFIPAKIVATVLCDLLQPHEEMYPEIHLEIACVVVDALTPKRATKI